MNENDHHNPGLHFVQTTAKNELEICIMSQTLSADERIIVLDNEVSIAQGHCSENARMSATYQDQTPVGFIMLHFGSDWEDGIDCAGVFLLGLMIAEPYQERRYGKAVIELLISRLPAIGVPELNTNFDLCPASSKDFYAGLSFKKTGDFYGMNPMLF